MVSLIFIFLAAVCNSIMDKLQFHFSKSVFSASNSSWWDPSTSWRNKWKNGDSKQGEKFFGSSTIFVFTTDAWHFFQSLMLLFFTCAVVSYNPIFNFKASFVVDAVIYRVLFGVVFELFWKYVWRKR